MAGIGTGDWEHRRFHAGGAIDSGDLSASLGLIGLRRELSGFPELSGARLSWVADVGAARLDASGGPSLGGIAATSSRLRLGVEAAFGGPGPWSGQMRLSGRHDGGEDISGWGAEWLGALAWSSGRFDARLQGRMLLSHEISGHEDRGLSLRLGLRARSNGTGLSFALAPTWGSMGTFGGGIGGATAGQSFGRLELWGDQRMRSLGAAAGRQQALQTNWTGELGYGISLGSGARLLRPYASYRHSAWRAGIELEGGWLMRLEFSDAKSRPGALSGAARLPIPTAASMPSASGAAQEVERNAAGNGVGVELRLERRFGTAKGSTELRAD